MKILVACEESQAVTIELRKLGHEAYAKHKGRSKGKGKSQKQNTVQLSPRNGGAMGRKSRR